MWSKNFSRSIKVSPTKFTKSINLAQSLGIKASQHYYENQASTIKDLNKLLGSSDARYRLKYQAIGHLRNTDPNSDKPLITLSPLGWEHINLNGDYI